MQAFRRTVTPIVLVCALGMACTGEDQSRAPTASGSVACAPGECVTSSDVGDVTYRPGAYRYQFGDVTATLSMDGSVGTLEVVNASGAELGEPGMYVISGNDERYQGTVASPSLIADGETATFDVTFPDAVKPDTVGLVMVLFGGSNFGAMRPVPEGS